MAKDNIADERLVSRAQYLTRVLDSLAKELCSLPSKPRAFKCSDGMGNMKNAPHMFRSQVLNPILQRQLRGIPDNEPTEVELAVGTSDKEVEAFYLDLDPLHPDLVMRTLRNLIYILPVRFSLASSPIRLKLLLQWCLQQHQISD